MNDHQPLGADSAGLEILLSRELDPLFWPPQRLGLGSAWWAHVPFAFWIIVACRPRLLVELGTHNGISYAAFCEAVLRARLGTRCYAVDTWVGDEHSEHYGEEIYRDLREFHDKRYAAFSDLLRSTFDDAVHYFENGSIDLLHLDGHHTYEAVKHDYEMWRPKLSDRAIVLFHDTNVRERDFGVYQFFAEISKQFPSFEFSHGFGLGIVAVGAVATAAVKRLCAVTRDQDVAIVRERFSHIGERWFATARETLGAAQAEAKDTEMISLRADLANRVLEIQELRDVAAERDTVIEKMQGEITSLGEALARTRQIGPTIVQLFDNLRFVLKRKSIMLADRAREAGQWAVAAHYYRRALDRNPNRPEIWIQYGHVLKEANRLSAAEQAYRQAIAGAPTLAEPYRYLGDVLSAQRKRDEAVTAYLQAHSLDPASPHALSGLRKLGWSEKDLVALG
jgi:tetratricopeptide (TPR) repeat protein